LSFKREGYKRSDFALRDALESIGYSGFWRLSARHWSKGLRELWRSLSKKAFTRSLQRLICNAPSPAATSSLLIGQHIARQALS
jgi:L-2-hydroxyglutarate oxidase